MLSKKTVTYTKTNSYHTLNEYTNKTKNIWIVFHGLGYLSNYFIKHFKGLDPMTNYIIAPQAPSKYYQGTSFKHVGACWLTRVDTKEETNNVLNYIDQVYTNEIKGFNGNLIILGYSQGVSIATRWIATRKIQCAHLILHSGGIPVELTPQNFEFLNPKTKVTYLYGDADEYIDEAKKTEASLKGTALFGNRLEIEVFKGVHEVNEPYINKVLKKS